MAGGLKSELSREKLMERKDLFSRKGGNGTPTTNDEKNIYSIYVYTFAGHYTFYTKRITYKDLEEMRCESWRSAALFN